MPEASNFSFRDHLTLLDEFLRRRDDIARRIEENLLNVRDKDTKRIRNRAHFEQLLNDCFFGLPSLASELIRLKGQLAAAHLADGFEPIRLDRFAIEFDPLELVIRAYEHWGATRWPGRSGRLMWAHVIYSVFFLRQLESLSLRIWDEGDAGAGERLQQLQGLLNRLNDHESGVVFVRDVRWLVQTAQGALTKHLEPYFRIAERISGSFADSVRLGLHAAGTKMAGGHLRSQVCYRAVETGRTIDDAENLAVARNSNSMDTALLLRDLVGSLEEYNRICAATDETADLSVRQELADAILQGISSDIELFVTRLDLLTPATMIEGLFIEFGAEGCAQLSALGRTHAEYLERYRNLIGRLAGRLKEDALAIAMQPDAYSPYGISYGFAADLLSNLAIDKLVSPTSPWRSLTFEDTFASRGNLEAMLGRAKALAALPKRPGEKDHFYHSAEFAAQIFGRLVAALEARALREDDSNASGRRGARIYVVSAESDFSVSAEQSKGCTSEAKALSPDSALMSERTLKPPEDSVLSAASLPGLPDGIVCANQYCFTSNAERVSSKGWTALPRPQILSDRNEGRYLASAECDGEWFAISKFILTLFISQGTDVLFSALPPKLIEILLLTCPRLIVLTAPEQGS